MFHMAHIMCHVYIYNNKKNVSLFMDNITQEQLVCGDSHIICVLIEVTQLFQATATVATSWWEKDLSRFTLFSYWAHMRCVEVCEAWGSTIVFQIPLCINQVNSGIAFPVEVHGQEHGSKGSTNQNTKKTQLCGKLIDRAPSGYEYMTSSIYSDCFYLRVPPEGKNHSINYSIQPT